MQETHTIDGNAAKAAAAGTSSIARAEIDLWSPDHYVEVTISVAGVAAGGCVRYSDSADSGFIGWYNFTAGQYEIYRRIGGTFNLRAQFTESAPSVPCVLRVEAVGTQIEIFLNDVSKLIFSNFDATDDTLNNNVRTGIISTNQAKIDLFVADTMEPAPTTAHHVLASYRFEEAAAPVENDLRYGEAFAVAAGDVAKIAGMHGEAFNFNGSTVLVAPDSIPWLPLAGTDKKATVSLWVRPDVAQPASDEMIIGEWNDNGSDASWRIIHKASDGSVEAQISFDGVASDEVVNAGALSAAWHHLVLTINETTGDVFLYKDGTRFGPAVITSWFATDTGLLLGGNQDGATEQDFFNGFVDDLVIIDVERIEEWVDTIYNGGVGQEFKLTVGAVAGGSTKGWPLRA